jgi:membrane protease YdiL (CAAX protease family)
LHQIRKASCRERGIHCSAISLSTPFTISRHKAETGIDASIARHPCCYNRLVQLEDQPGPEPMPSFVLSRRDDPVWSGWDVVLIGLVALLTIGFFSILALTLAHHSHSLRGLTADQQAQQTIVIVPAQMAAYIVVLFFMFALIERRYRRPFWTEISWKWPERGSLRYVPAGAVLAIAIQLSSDLLPIPKALPIEQFFKTPTDAYLMAALAVIAAPLIEELFFRGFLYPIVARRFGVPLGVVLTAAIFAVIHASQLAHAWGPLVLLFVVGLVLTITRARTGSVARGYLIHVSYNFTLFALMFFATGGFRHLQRLNE